MNKQFAKPWIGNKWKDGKMVKNDSMKIFDRLPETKAFMDRFLGDGNKRGGDYSEQTVLKYRIDLAEFFTFVNKDFKDVRDVDCESFYNYLKKRKLRTRSIIARIMTVKALFRYSVEKGIMQRNPMQKRIPSREMKPDDMWVLSQCLKRSDVRIIMEAVSNPRDKAILTLLYNHGCRIGELVNLKMEDIRMEEGTIMFDGKTGKRLNEMNSDTKNALKMWFLIRGPEGRHVFTTRFGNPVDSQSIRSMIQDVCIRTGVMTKKGQCEDCKNGVDDPTCLRCDWNRIVTPHSFRHTFICHSLADGVSPVELSKIAGHGISMVLYYSALSEIGKTYAKFKGIHGGDN